MDKNMIEDFSTQYTATVKDVASLVQQIDINKPTENVLSQDSTDLEILKFQAESQAITIGKLLTFIKNAVPLQEMAQEGPGTSPITVQEQKQYLEKIGKENFLATRMAQKRQDEQQQKKDTGGYFDDSRDPICTIPHSIATNTIPNVSDSALKLLSTFKGDTNQEAENLKHFLRAIYDVATTNNLNEKCVQNMLVRKLVGTARRIIDKYLTIFEANSPPTLRQIILKLEDRFMSEWSPEIATAKLSVYTKKPLQTYQALEGDISELVFLAARSVESSTRSEWIRNKEISVFKQAVSEEDKQLLYNENQSRSLSGLEKMNLSQMVDYLLKLYSEKKASATVSNLTSTPLFDDDSMQPITDKSKTKLKNKTNGNHSHNTHDKRHRNQHSFNNGSTDDTSDFEDDRQFIKADIKEEIAEIDEQYFDNADDGSDSNSSSDDEKHSNDRQHGNGNNFQTIRSNRNYNYNADWNDRKPSRFVTNRMVRVNNNCCLKCGSPDHKFEQVTKCVYGEERLMTKPCFNCQEGGHHHDVCIKNQQPQDSDTEDKLDAQCRDWPAMTKQLISHRPADMKSTVEDLPSIFPY